MAWAIEYTNEFGEWWESLNEGEQEDVASYVKLLEVRGPNLDHPYSSKIQGSKFDKMRELRPQHKGKPYRVFYAFDPRRVAILLIGGIKTGDNRFYEKFIPIADKIYEKHLEEIRKEGEKRG